ncbi:MAG: FAD-dependent oxidoreductase [Gammaproteobacteria bacterium]|nr:FAD-dependent oxidoreductase [Gammaproteobacteria bacterium]
MYDVCIIGAGVVGAAIARELAKFKLKICLLEKSEDVANGTTKANSGIVHGGYADKPGSVKAKFSGAGNRMFPKLEAELHFGFRQIGSLLLAFSDAEVQEIHKIYANGQKNNISGLEIVDSAFLRKNEPNLNLEAKAALLCKVAGVTSPYEFGIALAENAILNGVELKLSCEVIAIKKELDHFLVTTKLNDLPNHDHIKAQRVINAAGLFSDDVARMLGIKNFTINPKQGQYLLFDKDQGGLVNRVIFQVPTPNSKGVLVTPTYHGNLLVGPDATSAPEKEYLDTADQNLKFVTEMAKKSVPNFEMRKVITSFAGNRATPSTGDFIVEESEVKGFINVAGIESPGLTAAPAIAVAVCEIMRESGMTLLPNEKFNPERKPYKTIANMSAEELEELIKKEPAYGRVVCRCETVSEGEILDALQRSIPINSLDAIKRRTRAGMGRCQSGFCTPKIMEIICNATSVSMDKITKKGSGSKLLMGRSKKALQ